MVSSKLIDFDKAKGMRYLIGVDEVGRGCLAGPIVAAAVLIEFNSGEPLNDLDFDGFEAINDSKKLSEKKRFSLEPQIKANFKYSISSRSPSWIDEHGIEPANQGVLEESAKNLINELSLETDDLIVLVDGHGIRKTSKELGFEQKSIIKGDQTSFAVACASIIAKTYRDALMIELSKDFPGFLWESNKGYGSAVHTKAIKETGISEHHRKSFCQKILKAS